MSITVRKLHRVSSRAELVELRMSYITGSENKQKVAVGVEEKTCTVAINDL